MNHLLLVAHILLTARQISSQPFTLWDQGHKRGQGLVKESGLLVEESGTLPHVAIMK